MVFNKRKDRLIGSFDNDKQCCLVFYDAENDVGIFELRQKGHTGLGFRFARKEDVTYFETLLKKMKLKINDTFDEEVYDIKHNSETIN